jgi:hypothetical protein
LAHSDGFGFSVRSSSERSPIGSSTRSNFHE